MWYRTNAPKLSSDDSENDIEDVYVTDVWLSIHWIDNYSCATVRKPQMNDILFAFSYHLSELLLTLYQGKST